MLQYETQIRYTILGGYSLFTGLADEKLHPLVVNSDQSLKSDLSRQVGLKIDS